ncbi:hypothetical protein CARUB_v10021931mg [Capsella rubella]|uniref:Transmembrane protein n=1 Tax=Capsella rubella TaxID=81985 RepID=R0ICM3_9BRAS|nr:uncharacterized protein LOC17895651 [Capsella rubella]EOA34403.1 hypothetical protein CARUB_v10021931mg [Capsella rubella]
MVLWKKWASIISVIASCLFSFLIVFQVPLFRVACRNKRCETPLEVISSELIANELIPSSVVKTLLYPGAFAKSLLAGSKLPSFHHLFTSYGFDHMYPSSDIHHLEVFAGSCLCLLGALLNLFKPTRISFIATLLIYWGLLRDILLLDSAHDWLSAHRNSVRVYPTLFLASLSAFLSMRSDLRKIIRCCTSIPFSQSTKGD